jgi:surface antigen
VHRAGSGEALDMRIVKRAGIMGAVLLGSIVACGTGAMAQVSPFAGDTSKGLTESDLELLLRATHTINHGSLLRPGQSRSWTNPDSGAHGEIAFVKTTQNEGMACHQLHNTIYVADRADPGAYDLNWCLTPSGAWKIKG